ncbi:MAG TPA: ABC transporter ATP-binding protein [Candidatus Tectomicrobia bacterium]|nr:ABC transporter ATP-binding protein [Candidatus Tectomicrobia bacterium]
MSPFARRVLGLVRPHRRALALALAQIAALTAGELLKPWPLKIVIDSVLGGAPLPGGWLATWPPQAVLALACAALVGIYAFLGVVTVLHNRTTIAVGQRMVNDLRGALHAHLHRLSLAYHSRARAGDLLYRVTADTLAIQSLTMNCGVPAVTAVFLLAGMTVIMLRLDWSLTLLALAVCPALFVAIARLTRRMGAAAGQARERESEVYGVVQRAFASIRVVQAFTREEDEHRRFMAASARSLDASRRLYTLQTVYSGIVNVLIAVGTAAVVWVGARHVLDGTLSVGALVVFVAYLASLYGPVNSLFQVWGLAQSARAGVARVFEVLDVERDLPDGTRALPPGSVRGAVAWEGVSFAYVPGRPVLRDVTLRVRPGQRVAVVGPTGAGKSTLLGFLPRFHDPTAGRVLLDGVDLRELRLADLRRQIAMVLQPPLVLPASIRENIAFGRPGASEADIVEAARLAQVHETIEALPDGYDTLVAEQGASLSEGEKQRLTIARAIVRDAPILILDEPTSALDPETEARLLAALERLMAGRTTFVIAHRLSTVRGADLVVVLRHGEIVEQGPYDDLLAAGGMLARLHGAAHGGARGDA